MAPLFRSAIPPSPLGLYPDGDAVLLRLTLQGRFSEVPETLFSNRRHASQAGTKFDGKPREYAVWWNPDYEGRLVFPQWRRLGELWRVLAIAPIPLKDRARCSVALLRWTNWRRRRLLEDVTFHIKELLNGRPRK